MRAARGGTLLFFFLGDVPGMFFLFIPSWGQQICCMLCGGHPQKPSRANFGGGPPRGSQEHRRHLSQHWCRSCVLRGFPCRWDHLPLIFSHFPPSPTRFYPVSRRVPDYYSPYSPQYPEDYQYYPPGVRPDSICSMPAYERVSPPWALDDKRPSFRNGGPYQLREWKEHPAFGRQDVPLWLAGPGRQPAYFDEVDAASGSLRRMSLQPRSRSVPRSPSQGSYTRARVYSPVRSPSARFERLPPRGEEIYADPAAFMMRRSISSPKVSVRHGWGVRGWKGPNLGTSGWGCCGTVCAFWAHILASGCHRVLGAQELVGFRSSLPALPGGNKQNLGAPALLGGWRDGAGGELGAPMSKAIPSRMLCCPYIAAAGLGVCTGWARCVPSPCSRSEQQRGDGGGIACPSLVPGVYWGLFSPQYDYLGDRRPVPAGMFPYHYPASPTVHDKMVRALLAPTGGLGGGAARTGGSQLGAPCFGWVRRGRLLQEQLCGLERGCAGQGRTAGVSSPS